MRIFPILTAIAVAVAIYFVIMQRDELDAWFAAGAPAQEQTDTASVEKQDRVSVVTQHSLAKEVQNGIVLRGRTEAARRIDVRAETSGRVISEPVRKGASVTAGQVLCELDMGSRAAQLAEARARLANAQVSADNARALADRGVGPKTAVTAAEAALESARAGVARIEQDIANLKITAPFAGVLESDTAELGSLMSPGGACARILALDEIKLVGFATEQDISRLKTGARAGGELVSGRRVVGEVTFLSRSSDPVTRTFRVEITVPNPDLSIRDGETADIVIELPRVKAHLLPNNVLTLNDAGDLGVRVDGGGVAKFLPVEILRDTPEGLYLTGLPESVDVIVVGQEFVVDGTPITATAKQDLGE